MAWNQHLSNLQDVLSGIYFDKADITRVARGAGLKPAFLNLDGKPINVWGNVLEEADRRGLVKAIVQVANEEYPENHVLNLALDGTLTQVKGADIEVEGPWRPADDVSTLEKIMGKESTFLPISFLETGLAMSRSVVRVVHDDGTTGSGFLTERNLLVTNNHVLPDENKAKTAKVQFNYQKTAAGLDSPKETFRCVPDNGFLTSSDDDWTVVRLAEQPNETWGAIPVGTPDIHERDRVIVIQHPGGGPKTIALYHNLVTFAGERRVQYLTDTMPGSSGSPVFNDRWELVAVHCSGGWLREPGSKRLLFRNAGVAVGRIREGAKRLLSD